MVCTCLPDLPVSTSRMQHRLLFDGACIDSARTWRPATLTTR